MTPRHHDNLRAFIDNEDDLPPEYGIDINGGTIQGCVRGMYLAPPHKFLDDSLDAEALDDGFTAWPWG